MNANKKTNKYPAQKTILFSIPPVFYFAENKDVQTLTWFHLKPPYLNLATKMENIYTLFHTKVPKKL